MEGFGTADCLGGMSHGVMSMALQVVAEVC